MIKHSSIAATHTHSISRHNCLLSLRIILSWLNILALSCLIFLREKHQGLIVIQLCFSQNFAFYLIPLPGSSVFISFLVIAQHPIITQSCLALMIDVFILNDSVCPHGETIRILIPRRQKQNFFSVCLSREYSRSSRMADI